MIFFLANQLYDSCEIIFFIKCFLDVINISEFLFKRYTRSKLFNSHDINCIYGRKIDSYSLKKILNRKVGLVKLFVSMCKARGSAPTVKLFANVIAFWFHVEFEVNVD